MTTSESKNSYSETETPLLGKFSPSIRNVVERCQRKRLPSSLVNLQQYLILHHILFRLCRCPFVPYPANGYRGYGFIYTECQTLLQLRLSPGTTTMDTVLYTRLHYEVVSTADDM
jgi:hypothetical protein